MKLNDLGVEYKRNKLTEGILEKVEYLSNRYDSTKPYKKFQVETKNGDKFYVDGKEKSDVICSLRENNYDLNQLKNIQEINKKDTEHNFPESWSRVLNENYDNINIKYIATMNNKNSDLINESNNSKSYKNTLGLYFTLNEEPYALIKLNRTPLNETKKFKMIVPSDKGYEETKMTFNEFKNNYLPKKKSCNIFKITE